MTSVELNRDWANLWLCFSASSSSPPQSPAPHMAMSASCFCPPGARLGLHETHLDLLRDTHGCCFWWGLHKRCKMFFLFLKASSIVQQIELPACVCTPAWVSFCLCGVGIGAACFKNFPSIVDIIWRGHAALRLSAHMQLGAAHT